MTYRPYPNPDRARHQLARHDNETGPVLRLPRPLSHFEKQFFEGAAAMVKAAQPGLELAAARFRAAFQPRPVSSEETTT